MGARSALEAAREAVPIGEVPVGAVVVHEGRVIARAHNLRESRSDPTAHAEVLARATEVGAAVLRTDELGSIAVITDGARMWWQARH